MNHLEYIGGFHAVTALLQASPDEIAEIFILSGRKDARIATVIDIAQQHGITLQFCSRSAIDALFVKQPVQHQGVAVRCRAFAGFHETFLATMIAAPPDHPLLLLILDGVQDPHNLGACLRTANGFGVDAIIVPKDRACGLTPTVLKVASGAASTTPLVTVTNLSRTMKSLQDKGIWLVGMSGESDTLLAQIDLAGHIGIVVGSEGQGMRRLTQKHCDYMAKIPMQGSVASFNVSVAAAVALYEAQRQRK